MCDPHAKLFKQGDGVEDHKHQMFLLLRGKKKKYGSVVAVFRGSYITAVAMFRGSYIT